jgi:hypothetical protein
MASFNSRFLEYAPVPGDIQKTLAATFATDQ